MLNCGSFLLCASGGGIFDLLKIRKDKNNQERFSILVEAIQLVNLTHTLEKGINITTIFRGLNKLCGIFCFAQTIEGPFTLFAPTNDAFRRLPDGVLNKLLATPAELKTILLGHIVSGTYFLSGLTNESDLPTLDGGSNRIAVGNSKIIA